MKITAVPESQFDIPKEYKWVLLVVCAILLQYALTMYFFTMRARIQVFRRSFMRQFDEEHAKAFPGQEKAPEFGYPDTGNGYYGKRLPYDQWFKMNNGQRA